MPAKMKRTLLTAILLVVAIAFAVVIAQHVLLPTAESYRKIMEQSDRIELRASFVFNPEGGVDLAVITDPQEKMLLAKAVELKGLWLPFLDVADGRIFRIRAVHKGGVQDIIVRGKGSIKRGRWLIDISPLLMKTFEALVEKHGGCIPTGRGSETRTKMGDSRRSGVFGDHERAGQSWRRAADETAA